MVTENNYRSWKDGVPSANAEVFSYVRSLRHFTRWSRTIPDWDPLISRFFDYPPLFRHLYRAHQMRHLQLDVFSVYTLILTWPALVSIIDYMYFPNVTDLKDVDHQQAPPLSRPLRGRLSIEIDLNLCRPIFWIHVKVYPPLRYLVKRG